MKREFNIFQIILLLSMLLFSQKLIAQNTKILVQPATGNVVKIRWAMDAPATWKLGVTNGYYLKREKIVNGSVTETAWLNGGNAIQPLAQGNLNTTSPWIPFMGFTVTAGDTTYNFPYHMAMLGALYGDSINIGDKITKIKANPVNPKGYDSTKVLVSYPKYDSISLAQKHFTAMISAEMNFDAARVGGLGFIDNSVQSSGTYKYTLYSSANSNTPPNTIPDGCAAITINTIINPNENRTEKCYDITLGEGFESDPGINFEFVAEALLDSLGTPLGNTTPVSIGQVLSTSENVAVNTTLVLPGITINGVFPASGINVIKWLIPENAPYSKYNVFRSSSLSPTVFTKINTFPIVQLNESLGTAADTLYFSDIDSTKSVFLTYTYKIKGITLFEDQGAFSNDVLGRTLDAITVIPRISNYSINDTTSQIQATIRLLFALTAGLDTLKNAIKTQVVLRYEIERSSFPDSLFSLVKTENEKIASTIFYDVPSTDVNAFYLRIKVIYQGNKEPSYSSSIMIQLGDRTPPALPIPITVVTGYPKIENGKVVNKIKWPKNAESDFLGYRIFRKNFSKEMEMNITNSIISYDAIKIAANADSIDKIKARNSGDLFSPVAVDNFITLTDYMNSNSLNDSVYYQIMAIDKRFNQSKLSTPFGIAKPNQVPPVVPVFIKDSINYAAGAVYLEFSISKDPDITSLELYRTPINNQNISTLTPLITYNQSNFLMNDTTIYSLNYLDTDVKSGETYVYIIRVVDKYLANQDFLSEKPLIVEIPTTVNTGDNEIEIATFTSSLQRNPDWVKLSWTHSSTKVREYQVYRGEFIGNFVPSIEIPKIPIKSWKELTPDYKTFKDSEVKIGNSYRYMVRAIYNNGAFSQWKEIIKLDF